MSENLDSTIETTETVQDADDLDESTTTLKEHLKMQEELDENAAAVLGASNEKTCSYNDGYLKRQALYSCLTCIPETKTDPEKGAGICLACSYQCHDGHELVELYTKRNFRCDCGNSKFGEIKCNFVSSKDEINQQNLYNQNFSGLYCVCHRPYPDPEDPLPDEMIQCIICEDWYHSRHLGVEVPSGNFAEMICSTCVTKHEFLLHYDANSPKLDDSEAIVNVTSDEEKPEEKPKECKKPETKSTKTSSKFWPDISWRQQLCTCSECMEMYESEKVLFLLDVEDPVHLYEEKGKTKVKEAEDAEDRNLATQLNSLDRVTLVEAIAGYNDFKQSLTEYLNKFAQNKKVVREEDIREFFDGMIAKKKQKTENSVPHFCR